MALVQLSDAIVPQIFTQYMMNDTVQKARVFQSGIVTQDGGMASLLSGGGRLFQNPVWLDLDNSEPNIATDATTDVLVPKKLGSFKHQFIRQFRTQGWSTADLVRELAGSDPMARISARVSEYWARHFDRQVIKILTGVLADNASNDSGDMIYDATSLSGNVTVGGATVAASKMNPSVILEGKQTLGDEATNLSLLIMHSRIYTNLQLQNLIAFIPNSQGVINIPTFMGYEVLVSDQVPVTQSGSDYIYTTYLVSKGALGFAESPPAMPVETRREPLQGNGAGVEILVTRRQYAFHP